MSPSAKVIEDSISQNGHRLTTMEIVCHRFVLAEFNTHRAFSRNSASSRAIPVKKQIDKVWNDPAYPLSWPREQRGMQGAAEQVDDPLVAEVLWAEAMNHAVGIAERLIEQKVHKSVTNRLLEPFMWHTIIVTATDWQGFFDQRCSPLAQPEIRAVADLMREAYDDSTPRLLNAQQWHLPYVDQEDLNALVAHVDAFSPSIYRLIIREAQKVSAARCARVSYLTHEGKRDITADLALYERLVTADPPHWSPLEHVATPWPANVSSNVGLNYQRDGVYYRMETPRPMVGNLLGWRSLRTEFEGVET